MLPPKHHRIMRCYKDVDYMSNLCSSYSIFISKFHFISLKVPVIDASQRNNSGRLDCEFSSARLQRQTNNDLSGAYIENIM